MLPKPCMLKAQFSAWGASWEMVQAPRDEDCGSEETWGVPLKGYLDLNIPIRLFLNVFASWP